VRKIARFSWQLAQRNKLLPITARGGGTDTSGAAIGSGVMLSFTAHMNRILALDPKKEFVTVEPGITFQSLQQTLYTHGLFLPPYPATGGYATIGGGLANNSIGEKTVKYGNLRNYTEKLSVVLSNGEVIETGPIGKRELNKKLGLTTMEGDIYRGIDALIEENQKLMQEEAKQFRTAHNRAGYNIFDVKKKGSFNLTPLILGSQGSLGIITEATLQVVRHNPLTDVVVVSLPDLAALQDVLPQIIELKPSMCELINKGAVQQITRLNSTQLKGVISHPADAVHLILEFDDSKEADKKKSLKKLTKYLSQIGGHWYIAQNNDDRDRIHKFRRSVSTLFWENHGGSSALPVAEDVSVPVDRLSDFMHQAHRAFVNSDLAPAMWGHAGDGIIRIQPVLNLSNVGDRQRLFKLSDFLYKTAVTMGGSISGSAGDGRVRAPYMGHVYGPEMVKLMMQIKKIFDPYGILNRGVKTATADEVKSMMRGDYSRGRHEHLPHN
jgi:FAD/FMN-containing dehydrogenase